jgi:hypothetical protein
MTEEQDRAALQRHKVVTEGFRTIMMSKLWHHRAKGDWINDLIPELLDKLKAEVVELESALAGGLQPEEVVREAADIANFAMFIAEVYSARRAT